MNGITFRDDCEGVGWARLTQYRAADDFDNARTPEEPERSFRASARGVLARDRERVSGRWPGRYPPR